MNLVKKVMCEFELGSYGNDVLPSEGFEKITIDLMQIAAFYKGTYGSRSGYRVDRVEGTRIILNNGSKWTLKNKYEEVEQTIKQKLEMK